MSSFYRAHILEALDATHVRVRYIDLQREEVLETSNLNLLIEKHLPFPEKDQINQAPPEEASPLAKKETEGTSQQKISDELEENQVVFDTTPIASGEDDSDSILNDPEISQWMRNELVNMPQGIWFVRLARLFLEKFQQPLDDEVIKQLQYRPDIARVEEPIEGRYLLYSPAKQKAVGKVVGINTKDAGVAGEKSSSRVGSLQRSSKG